MASLLVVSPEAHDQPALAEPHALRLEAEVAALRESIDQLEARLSAEVES